jgi:hypothetical protein
MQNTVYTEAALGVPGAKVVPNQSVYTALNYIAASGGVDAGKFAFLNASGQVTNTATSNTFLGFVQRDAYYPLGSTVTSGGTLHIEAGDSPTVAIKGQYYAAITTSCAAGDALYSTASGTLTTTSSGGTATGWSVVQGTTVSSGGTIIIQNWS